MTISEAAKASGVNAKLIRHYEAIGIIPKPRRTNSGYRDYTMSDVHILTFVRRARSLGFSMAEIGKLVSLWQDKNRASSEVKNLALAHVQSLEVKIKELQEMASTLNHLAKNCQGDSRPDCPIIKSLANENS